MCCFLISTPSSLSVRSKLMRSLCNNSFIKYVEVDDS